MNIDNPQKITLCYWESASPINIPGISGTVDNFNETSFPIDELKRVEIKEVSELQTAPDEVFWAIRRTCYEITQENIKKWKSGNIAPDDRLFWLHMLRNYEIVEGVLIDNSIEALRRTDYNNWSLCVLVTDDYFVEVGGFIFFTESELLELERTNRHLWRDIREALRHDDFDYDFYDASLMAGADPIYRWYYDKVHKIIAMCNGDEKPIGIELSEIINEALIRSRITEEPRADDDSAEAGAGGDPADKLKGLPDEDREIFEKMLIYASELEKTKPKDKETDHFKKPEGNFSQEVKRSKFKKIEIDDCELGKVSYGRYWIRKISISNRYWVFKKH